MNKKSKALTNKSGHVRELTREDIRHMKPAKEILPAELVDALPKRQRYFLSSHNIKLNPST